MSPPNTSYLLWVPIYMMHLLSANCYISTIKIVFPVSNIVFCHSQVTNMETEIWGCSVMGEKPAVMLSGWL